jgi:hypothetical protein
MHENQSIHCTQALSFIQLHCNIQILGALVIASRTT